MPARRCQPGTGNACRYHCTLLDPRRAKQHHNAARPQAIETLLESRRTHRVIDDTHTLAAGDAFGLRLEIGLRVENHVGAARPARERGLFRGGDGPDDRGGPEHLRHLREQQTDPARRRVNQHRVARLDGIGRMRKVVRGHALEHHGRGAEVIEVRWNRHEPRGGHDGIFRVAPADLRPRHAFADARGWHFLADRDNRAGTLVAGDKWQLAGVVAAALIIVDEVNSRRVEAHERLARAWLRHRERFQLEDFGAAEARDVEGAVLAGNFHRKIS